MTTIVKQIRAAGLSSLLGTGLISVAQAVLTGMTGNTAYPSPPVALSLLTTGIASYTAALAAALDGGKIALQTRNVARAALIATLEALAHYVELTSAGNMTTFMSSGFPALVKTSSAGQPLAPASIVRVDAGATSGQLQAVVKAVANARSYDLRYAPTAAAASGPWTIVSFTAAKKAPPVTGLTPGTSYTFEVRALGSQGYTDWSNPVTCICT